MNWRKWTLVGGTLLVLIVINLEIYHKEKVIDEGELVLLELAPYDPRSLMQGDYMRLRYQIAREADRDIPSRGYAIVTVNADAVASLVRYQKDNEPLKADERAIQYFKQGRRVRIGAESFFFQEGKAEQFEGAKYGALRLEGSGKSVLVGLYDENYKDLGRPADLN